MRSSRCLGGRIADTIVDDGGGMREPRVIRRGAIQPEPKPKDQLNLGLPPTKGERQSAVPIYLLYFIAHRLARFNFAALFSTHMREAIVCAPLTPSRHKDPISP